MTLYCGTLGNKPNYPTGTLGAAKLDGAPPATVRGLIPRLFIFLSMHVLEMLHLPSNFVYFSSLTFLRISRNHIHEKLGTFLFFILLQMLLPLGRPHYMSGCPPGVGLWRLYIGLVHHCL